MLSAIRHWLRLWSRGPVSRAAKRKDLRGRRGPVPACERLEDRVVLATFNVTTTADGGAGSLRQAILDARNNADASNTINLPAGTYQLNKLVSVDDNTGVDGDLDFGGSGKTYIIAGADKATTAIVGNDSRVIDIDGATVTLQNLTVRGGRVTKEFDGGGIRAIKSANLTLTNVAVTDNHLTASSFEAANSFANFSPPGRGAGLFFAGTTLAVTNSSFDGNRLASTDGTVSRNLIDAGSLAGAGLYIGAGTATLAQVAITGNAATAGNGINVSGVSIIAGSGGSVRGVGLYIDVGAVVTVDRSLVADNLVGRPGVRGNGLRGEDGVAEGGGIYNAGALTLQNSTVSGNSAPNRALDPVGFDLLGNIRFDRVTNSHAQGGGLFAAAGSSNFVTFSTIANNTSFDEGGGVFIARNAGVGLRGTLVGDNESLTGHTTANDDVHGSILLARESLVEAAGAKGLTDGFGVNNIVGVDPQLGPRNSAGVHPLSRTSPAINKGGLATFTENEEIKEFTVDQIGQPRHVGQQVDIGAFELPASESNVPKVDEVIPFGIAQVDIAFSEDVTGGDQLANFGLVNAGADQTFGTNDDLTIAGTVSYLSGLNATTFTASAALPDGKYRLTVLDNITAVVGGRKLDGDNNGAPGGNFTTEFTFLIPKVVQITHDQTDKDVGVNQPVVYTVKFGGVIDATSLDAADFKNLGSSTLVFDSITPVGTLRDTFEVKLHATNTGNIQLALADIRTILNSRGDAFPGAAVSAPDTINVSGFFVVDVKDDKPTPQVSVDEVIATTFLFSRAVDASTVNVADFENLGTAPGTITIDTADAGQSKVVAKFTPSGTGTVQMALVADRSISDVEGNAMATEGSVGAPRSLVVSVPFVLSMVADVDITTKNRPVNYSITFATEMDPTTVNAADFVNIGTAQATIGTPTTFDNRTFVVPVTPTTLGTVHLALQAVRSLTDAHGDPLGPGTVTANGPVQVQELTFVLWTISSGANNRFVSELTFNVPLDLTTIDVKKFFNSKQPPGGTFVVEKLEVTNNPRVLDITIAPKGLGPLQLGWQPLGVSDGFGNSLESRYIDDTVLTVTAVAN